MIIIIIIIYIGEPRPFVMIGKEEKKYLLKKLLVAFPVSRGTKNCATLANCGKEVNITRARRAHQAVENLRNESRAQKSSSAS